MNHQIIEKEYWERNIEILVERNEIQDQLNLAYNEARTYITHKGFRKGHVPMSIIKSIYGKQVEYNALGDIAVEFFNNVIKENKLSFIGEPKLTNIEELKDGFKFIFSYEIMPEFELADYHGLNIDEPVHRVTDEEIEKQIEEISINNGNLTPADQIEDDLHIANVIINEIDLETGLPLVGAKSEQTDIFLHSPYVAPDLKSSLLNLKKGDSFKYKPKESDPNAPDKTFLVTIEGVVKLVPAEMTDEFIKTLTQERLASLQDMKDDIGFRLQEQWEQKSRQAMEEQLVSKLVKMNEFEVPRNVLMTVIEGMTEDLKKQYKNVPSFQNVTARELYNDLKPSGEFRLKWEIIRQKIAEKENLKVEDFDVESIVESEAKRRNSDIEKVKEEILSNPNITNPILYKKVVDLVLDFAVTNEVEFDEHGHYHSHDNDSDLYDMYDDHDHDHEHHDHEHHDHEHHDHEHHDHEHHDHEHHDHEHEEDTK